MRTIAVYLHNMEETIRKYIVLLRSLFGNYSFGSCADGLFITRATSFHKCDQQVTPSHFAPLRSFASIFRRLLPAASCSWILGHLVAQARCRSERQVRRAGARLPALVEMCRGVAGE